MRDTKKRGERNQYRVSSKIIRPIFNNFYFLLPGSEVSPSLHDIMLAAAAVTIRAFIDTIPISLESKVQCLRQMEH